MKRIIICAFTIFQLTDDQKACTLAMGFMRNTDKYNKLHQLYFKKVAKVIGGVKAATYAAGDIYPNCITG